MSDMAQQQYTDSACSHGACTFLVITLAKLDRGELLWSWCLFTLGGSACLADACNPALSPFMVLARILTTLGCGIKIRLQDPIKMCDGSRICYRRHSVILNPVSVLASSVSTISLRGLDRS